MLSVHYRYGPKTKNTSLSHPTEEKEFLQVYGGGTNAGTEELRLSFDLSEDKAKSENGLILTI